MKLPVCITLFLVTIFSICTLQAGTQAIREVKFNFNQIATLSKGLERVLAKKHVRVAIISRIGLSKEILPEGVNFSHSGFAVYSRIKTKDGRMVPGYAVYNLYQGEQRNGRSFLAQDYPVDYYAVAQELKAGVVIPNDRLQQALAKTIMSDGYKDLHNPRYSVLSNPNNTEYQNCTEFVLDVIFSSIYKTRDTRQLKTNISAFFNPQPILVDSFKLAIAESTMPDVTTADHDGPLAIVTFSSIARFLLEHEIAKEAFSFSVDPTTLYGTTESLEL